jgi:hypothetical protein
VWRRRCRWRHVAWEPRCGVASQGYSMSRYLLSVKRAAKASRYGAILYNHLPTNVSDPNVRLGLRCCESVCACRCGDRSETRVRRVLALDVERSG